jgi:hypothetical protein
MITDALNFNGTSDEREEKTMDKETVDRVKKEAEAAYVVYIELKKAYDAASEKYLKLNRRFQAFDYELALTDGRLKVIKIAAPKEVKPATLSLSQLQAIAEALGIKLDPSQEDNKSIEEEDANEETI